MTTHAEHSKYILVTGCSSGIGLCAALSLQKRGYKVIASVRNSNDVKTLQALGLKHIVCLDLDSSTSIDSAVKEVLEICDGKLFALFNNAAFGQPGAVEDLSRDTLRANFETNLFGTHELTIKLLPAMLKLPDARIIQNSSVLGLVAMPMRGAYNATKFALEGLSDTMRLELRNTNVRVILIEPGPIKSLFRKNALEAFERNVDIGASRHREKYEEVLGRLKKTGPASKFTLEPEAVVKKLSHALESRRPKNRYYVTTPTYIVGFLKRILSSGALDKFCLKAGDS